MCNALRNTKNRTQCPLIFSTWKIAFRFAMFTPLQLSNISDADIDKKSLSIATAKASANTAFPHPGAPNRKVEFIIRWMEIAVLISLGNKNVLSVFLSTSYRYSSCNFNFGFGVFFQKSRLANSKAFRPVLLFCEARHFLEESSLSSSWPKTHSEKGLLL